ncbi:ferredoxin [Streptomyces sp. NPDC058457]|uniref:ferredoxin n=1 Tax=Streptomyces sp. NPDC058457 TaxID=3346507 RepID=UPI00364FC04E
MRLSVDEERCVGAGQCVWALPEVFAQSERTGTVVLLRELPARETGDRVRAVVRACPSGALRLIED